MVSQWCPFMAFLFTKALFAQFEKPPLSQSCLSVFQSLKRHRLGFDHSRSPRGLQPYDGLVE
jgi:hypothetical protein